MMSMGAENSGQCDGEQWQLHAVARKNGGGGGCCKEDEDGGFGIVFLHKKIMGGVVVN